MGPPKFVTWEGRRSRARADFRKTAFLRFLLFSQKARFWFLKIGRFFQTLNLKAFDQIDYLRGQIGGRPTRLPPKMSFFEKVVIFLDFSLLKGKNFWGDSRYLISKKVKITDFQNLNYPPPPTRRRITIIERFNTNLVLALSYQTGRNLVNPDHIWSKLIKKVLKITLFN